MLVTGELQSIEHNYRALYLVPSSNNQFCLSSVLVKQSNMLSSVPSQTIDKLQLFLVSALCQSPQSSQATCQEQCNVYRADESFHLVHQIPCIGYMSKVRYCLSCHERDGSDLFSRPPGPISRPPLKSLKF